MSVLPQNVREATVMKILLLGQSNVGKTSLVTRYTHDKFDAENNLLTVGIDIRRLNKQINGKHILLELWDTAGQQKYKTIPQQYFRGIQGILLVYDITDSNTFQKIQDWLDKIQQNSDSSMVSMSLVGNKLDLECRREVQFQQAESFATSKGMGFTETSAKNSVNVEKMFTQAIKSIIKKGIKCATKSIKLDCQNFQREPLTNQNSCCS